MIKSVALGMALWLISNVSAEAYFSMARKRPDVLNILRGVADRTGVPYSIFHSFGNIESSMNPHAKTGSYKGLFQLSNTEFHSNGGGNIYNAEDNANAFANIVKRNSNLFKQTTGRDPTGFDLYMMHQQGTDGYAQHLKDPTRPAWQSMYATREGREKGPGWSKKAIWGNLGPQDKRRFGSVDNVTSGDFLNSWKAKVERFGGGNGMNAVASEAGVAPPLPGQRITFPDKNRYDTAPSKAVQASARMPEDAGVRTTSGYSRKTSDVEATLPSSRRDALNSDEGYGRISSKEGGYPPDPTSRPTDIPAPNGGGSGMGSGSAPQGNAGYDFPWPGTAPLTWSDQGLKPGSAISTPQPDQNASAGVSGKFGNPPLFRNFIASIFGGEF